MRIRIDRIEPSGKIPTRTFVVYVVRVDTGAVARFGYHESQFQGMTKLAIRAFILADIKATMNASQPDASGAAGFSAGEEIDLNGG